MSLVKAHAIILHSRRQGETSKVLSLFSNEFGKLSLMAKGSRGVRSKYLGTLEPFNHVSIVFYKKEQRFLQYLSQASIIDSYNNLHEKLGKMSLAAIPCEIIEKCEEFDHSHPKHFQLLLNTLNALDKNEIGLRNIVRAFQIQYISLYGFEPYLSACNFCSDSQIADANYFSLEHGTYSCEKCGYFQEFGKMLSHDTIETLRWLQKCPIDKAHSIKVVPEIGDEIDSFLLNYYKWHIESMAHFKSIDYLKKLQHDLG